MDDSHSSGGDSNMLESFVRSGNILQKGHAGHAGHAKIPQQHSGLASGMAGSSGQPLSKN